MDRIEEQRQAVTLEQAKADIVARGFRVSAGAYEDDNLVVAFSVEHCGPETYGHPSCTARFSKLTGWYTVS